MTDTPDKKDVVPSQYRERYKATGGGNGDFIAKALSKVSEDGVEALSSVKRENGIDAKRWADFNPGMQRMNLANVLRASFLKGETIKILGKEYNAKHLAEDANVKLADDDKTLAKLATHLELQDNDRTVAALRKLFFSPPKKTAEERAAEKKARDDAKAAEKQKKADEKAAAKAKREADKAEAKRVKDAEKAAAQEAKAKAVAQA